MNTSEAVNIKVNRNTTAVHLASRMEDGMIQFPKCGAPGNTIQAFRAFRPVIVEAEVTCKRCLKSA